MSNQRSRFGTWIVPQSAGLLAVAYLGTCRCEGQEYGEHRHREEDTHNAQRLEAIAPLVHLAPEMDGSLNSLRLDDFEQLALANNPTLAQATAQANAAFFGPGDDRS